MRRLYTLLLLALTLGFAAARRAEAADAEGDGASAVEQAIVKAQADIERDTAALNARRADLAEQRRPLAAQRESLQKTVKAYRADVERIRRLKNQGEKELAAQDAEAAAWEEEHRFLSALFVEYARAMETRVGAAEAARLVERLRPIQAALSREDEATGFADAVGDLLALAADSNAARWGGFLFNGVALDQNGIERPGRFAVLGPMAYFASEGAGPAGLALTRFGTAQPAIYDRFSEDLACAIRSLVTGGAAHVPVDVTGGDAIKVAEARPTFLAHLKKGGFVMIPLLAVALAAVVLSLWKAVELGAIQGNPGEPLKRVMAAVRRDDVEAARETAARMNPPLRSLVEEAMAHRNAPRDHMEEILHERVLGWLPRLERNLGTLAVLGGVAPLLGLLGTVTGMIHTFQLVTIFGSGDAKLLSGGISEALVTTETGLAIAIPVLLAHAFLARRARGILGALERAAVAMVNELTLRSSAR